MALICTCRSADSVRKKSKKHRKGKRHVKRKGKKHCKYGFKKGTRTCRIRPSTRAIAARKRRSIIRQLPGVGWL